MAESIAALGALLAAAMRLYDKPCAKGVESCSAELFHSEGRHRPFATLIAFDE